MSPLEAVLAEAQRLGMLGSRPILEVIEHARAFVEALPPSSRRVIDLGAGGGVPGLVVATFRPDVSVTLVDRRQKRTDFLERAVRRLGYADRCEVWCRDLADVGRDVKGPSPSTGRLDRWDAAVTRGLGPPEITIRWARRLVTEEGVIVISEPPAGTADRWPAVLLKEVGVERVLTAPGGVVVFRPTRSV